MAIDEIKIKCYNAITKKCVITQKQGTVIWRLKEIYTLNN